LIDFCAAALFTPRSGLGRMQRGPSGPRCRFGRSSATLPSVDGNNDRRGWGGREMKRSTDRILTTHVGSLIRPAALRAFLSAKEAGESFDHAAYAKCLKDTVAEVVRKQADIGIDVISDGEFGKAISWAQYALFRLGGFERRPFAGGNPFTR